MRYMGSKNRLSKELVPIINSYITTGTKGYIEPFVGGANIIDKINCDNKFGFDIHKELIALLNYVKCNPEKIPDVILHPKILNRVLNSDEYSCKSTTTYGVGLLKNNEKAAVLSSL